MMLTATPYDLILSFCRDADFRLPVNIPEDLITVGYETIRPSAPDYNAYSCLRRPFSASACLQER